MIKGIMKAFVLVIAIVALMAASVGATGTLAGTTISNSLTVNYKDANLNPMDAVTSNTVTTEVESVHGLDLSPESYPATGVNELKVRDFPFVVTNTGNDYDTFSLGVTGIPSGWSAVIYCDEDGDGVLDPEDTITSSTGILNPSPPTIQLPSAYQYPVIVRVSAPPAPTIINMTADIILTAVSAGSSTMTADSHILMDVNQAVISVDKSAEVAGPMPLQPFDYTITVANSGAVEAYDVVVTDVLPSDLTFIGPVLYDADGAGTAYSTLELPSAYAGGAVTVNIGSLAAGTAATVSFEVMVGEEVPEDTAIGNTAWVSYDDLNDYNFTASDLETIIVSSRGGVDVEAEWAAYANPGDLLQVPFTIENTGNGADDMKVTAIHTGSLSLAWTIMWDSNGDGSYESPFGETSPSDTWVGQTGAMPKDAVYRYLATATVPPGTADALKNIVRIWAVSTNGPMPFASDSIVVTNTVKAPIITAVKQVDKASSIPGELLTYTITITNTGTGDAKIVLAEDDLSPISQFVEFVGGSIKVDGISQTDALDADYASFTANVVRMELPSVDGTLTTNAKSTYIVTFQVMVK